MHLFHLHSAPGLHPKALFHLSNQLDYRSRRQVHSVKADVKYYGSVASQQFCCKMALLSKFHISLATRTDFVKIVKFMWILFSFINADVNRALFFPFMVPKKLGLAASKVWAQAVTLLIKSCNWNWVVKTLIRIFSRNSDLKTSIRIFSQKGLGEKVQALAAAVYKQLWMREWLE